MRGVYSGRFRARDYEYYPRLHIKGADTDKKQSFETHHQRVATF